MTPRTSRLLRPRGVVLAAGAVLALAVCAPAAASAAVVVTNVGGSSGATTPANSGPAQPVVA
jgi:hypothetical protein